MPRAAIVAVDWDGETFFWATHDTNQVEQPRPNIGEESKNKSEYPRRHLVCTTTTTTTSGTSSGTTTRDGSSADPSTVSDAGRMLRASHSPTKRDLQTTTQVRSDDVLRCSVRIVPVAVVVVVDP